MKLQDVMLRAMAKRITWYQAAEILGTRFVEYDVPFKAIATSSAQNDSGVFEPNFRDERYSLEGELRRSDIR